MASAVHRATLTTTLRCVNATEPTSAIPVTDDLLLVATVLSGLLAGVFVAFSLLIMLFDRRRAGKGPGARVRQMAGLSSSNAVANRNSGVASTASS